MAAPLSLGRRGESALRPGEQPPGRSPNGIGASRWSPDGLQVDDEDQRRVGRDAGGRALRAVGQVRRDDQLAPAADLHADEPLVPAGDDAAGAQGEREDRAAGLPGGVEDRAVLGQRAEIVDGQCVALLGGGPGADDGVY